MFAYPSFTDPMTPVGLFDGVPAKRALAWMVDTVLVAFLVALIVPFTGFLALFFLGALYLAVNVMYRWIGLARHSATLGMRLVGVELRDIRGGRIDGATALAHTLGYAASVAFVLPQVASVILMAFSQRGQGLSDHILSTVMINAQAGRD